MDEYDKRYANLQQINEEIVRDDNIYKQKMYQKEKQIEAISKDNYHTKNKYSETLSKMSVTTKTATGNILIFYLGTIGSRSRLKPMTSMGTRTTNTIKEKKPLKMKNLDSSGSLERNPIKEKLEKEKIVI